MSHWSYMIILGVAGIHADWPQGHHFQFYKLEIEDIFLVNWFGGARPLTPDEYLQYKTWALYIIQ